MSDEETHRHGAFFGRRKGHPLRSRQAELFETLLPRLAIDVSKPAQGLTALFPSPADDVHLEIGFGGAEHLLGRAKANPRIGFIGAEPFVNGMAKALAAIDDAKLANVRLHHADAVDLLDWLPAASLGRIDLLYPDPWPKRRHWKRRFVNDANIVRLARVLKAGGEFRFATDWANYAEWTLARMMRARDFTWTAERADDWRKPWVDFTQTRYEAKAIREGRVPCYLRFKRN
ncbi:MAG TPA: tRNA (guanosine(46)-N7)-methyltransferase TrmB [Xanthobacteraceae bacterium]|nr:tRNA (guanosine(46)-N7)-methyltransferase TrmB [Xanthobacteraceae bacterium]